MPAPADAPRNAFRGVPIAHRDDDVRRRLASGRIPDAPALTRVWERALAASEWTGPNVWLHGDLHPANLLLTPSGSLAAVIDFGDITAGDPATDLATAWLTFDQRARRVFTAALEERRGVDEATWDRARGWALVIATAVVELAGTTGGFGRRRGVRAGAAAARLTGSPGGSPSTMRWSATICTDAAAARRPPRRCTRLGSCPSPMPGSP